MLCSSLSVQGATEAAVIVFLVLKRFLFKGHLVELKHASVSAVYLLAGEQEHSKRAARAL